MSQSNVRFVDCTLQSYLNLTEKDSSAIYVVSTDIAFNDNFEAQQSVPCLIFKGAKLIGNSGTLVRHSANGILTVGENQINIINPDALSTNIVGVPGQTLFIIDEFTDADGAISNSTYLYYWSQPNPSSAGTWKNANLNYINRMSIGDREITSAELGRLLELLY